MSRQFCYKSILAPYMNELIKMKESCRQHILRYQYILKEIDDFYCKKGITRPIITKDIIKEWRETRLNDRPSTLYAKYLVWALLARYMSRQGEACFIPKPPRFSSGHLDFIPYIYTQEQIRAIFEKCDKLRLSNRSKRTSLICIPAILRLLYSTGLRLSEALSIRNKDVQLDIRQILIRDPKNGTDRIVPIDQSLHEVLAQYRVYRDKMPLNGTKKPDNFFFIRADGSACTDKAISWWFRILLEQCNIPFMGDHRGPRIHDLRHTFAVHSFMRMIRAGMELYTCLPIISTCLGHKSLSATEKYVRMTAEIYPDLMIPYSELSTSIYPKLLHNEY